MNTTLISGGIVAVGALIGGALGIDGAKNLTTSKPVTLSAIMLEYQDGHVVQQHQVTGAPLVVASWEAKIERDGATLCRGSSQGGTASYAKDSGPKPMTPAEWTNDNACPDTLSQGDVLWARWEYEVNGATVAVERSSALK
jgi:hypothetical protein